MVLAALDVALQLTIQVAIDVTLHVQLTVLVAMDVALQLTVLIIRAQKADRVWALVVGSEFRQWSFRVQSNRWIKLNAALMLHQEVVTAKVEALVVVQLQIWRIAFALVLATAARMTTRML